MRRWRRQANEATSHAGEALPQAEQSFASREILCADREAAAAEAQRRQEQDDDVVAEWIYLRNNQGHWVARRTPRDPAAQTQPRSFRRSLLDTLIDTFHPEDLLP
jgi:hypothetical protein